MWWATTVWKKQGWNIVMNRLYLSFYLSVCKTFKPSKFSFKLTKFSWLYLYLSNSTKVGLAVKFAKGSISWCELTCLLHLIFSSCLPQQQSKNNKECVLWNLTTSLPYELRIRCDPTEDCVLCPRSEVIVVPPGEFRACVLTDLCILCVTKQEKHCLVFYCLIKESH